MNSGCSISYSLNTAVRSGTSEVGLYVTFKRGDLGLVISWQFDSFYTLGQVDSHQIHFGICSVLSVLQASTSCISVTGGASHTSKYTVESTTLYNTQTNKHTPYHTNTNTNNTQTHTRYHLHSYFLLHNLIILYIL